MMLEVTQAEIETYNADELINAFSSFAEIVGRECARNPIALHPDGPTVAAKNLFLARDEIKRRLTPVTA